MGNIWFTIYGLWVWCIAVNALLIPIIRKKTQYPYNKQGDPDMGVVTWLSIFFAPFMFLFLKQIRVYRKHRYLKSRIRYYKFTNNPIDRNGFTDGLMQPEIDKLERIYKISLLYQKTKRNKLKNKFKI